MDDFNSAQPVPPPPVSAPATNLEERTWAAACHLSSLVTYFPFANVVLPLVIWSLKRDQMKLVDDQGKEVLNFQITMMIAYAVCIALIFVLIGIPMLVVLHVYHIVISIVGAIKAHEGVAFRYPLTLRLVT